MPSGSGVNDALDRKVYETLVRDFGEEKAKQILGGEPARRRAQVPDVIGKKAKPGPALTRSDANRERGVDWKERADRDEDPRLKVVRYRRHGVECSACGVRVPGGDDHILVTYPRGPQRRFCPPCGVKEKR
jgi:hypothetical protein